MNKTNKHKKKKLKLKFEEEKVKTEHLHLYRDTTKEIEPSCSVTGSFTFCCGSLDTFLTENDLLIGLTCHFLINCFTLFPLPPPPPPTPTPPFLPRLKSMNLATALQLETASTPLGVVENRHVAISLWTSWRRLKRSEWQYRVKKKMTDSRELYMHGFPITCYTNNFSFSLISTWHNIIDPRGRQFYR